MEKIHTTKTWTKASEDLAAMRPFKVIRVYRFWSRSRIEALTAVRKGEVDEFISAEFAIAEQPKGWFGAILKQMFG